MENNSKSSINKSVSIILRDMRVKSGLTEKKIAELLNISQQQVSRHENDKANLTLVKISEYLAIYDMSWGQFLTKVQILDEKFMYKNK
ncbi:helix-turn-helix domain-containing protein [Providencia rettgeri]